ncbi:MAG TPA: trigger factor [Balneolaceae bacterium]|nr:trigger factor [Balneolaceae bacterium]
MDISVQELTSVDKEITIKANREDLADKFNSAYKKYQNQIQMPGFRPGRVPLSIIKKRFGKDIELEEIQKYVEETFEQKIVPEYEPVGESKMLDLEWEDGELEVKFKIGAKPEFDLVDLSTIEVDKMVHDVTDEEVEEEIERMLEKQGNWEEVDEKITSEHRVVVDAATLDQNDEPVEGEVDEDQKIDLSDEGSKEFLEALEGKKAGDKVKMEVGEEDEKDKFEIHVKKVEKKEEAELTDEFAKEQSEGEAKNVDELKSYIKSRMQQYYDESSKELFQQEVRKELTSAHDFEIPDVFKDQILNSYVEYLKQQMGGQDLPPDFDLEDYKNSMSDQAEEEGKWIFINQKLQEHFDDIEITPEDIDAQIATESARYGMPVDQMKNYYAQNPNLLDNLRNTIREKKVFDKLEDVVTINELSKDEFRSKREAEQEKEKEENEQE